MGPTRYCQHLIVWPEKKIKQEPVAASTPLAGRLLFGVEKVAFVSCAVFFYKATGTGS